MNPNNNFWNLLNLTPLTSTFPNFRTPSVDKYADNFSASKLSATSFPNFSVSNERISSEINFFQSDSPYIFEKSAAGFARYSTLSLHFLAALSVIFGQSAIGSFIIFAMNLDKMGRSHTLSNEAYLLIIIRHKTYLTEIKFHRKRLLYYKSLSAHTNVR